MNPATIDKILSGLAAGLRLGSTVLAAFGKHWTGAEKLALELEATASKTDAFRSDPVFMAEIEANRLSDTWPAKS